MVQPARSHTIARQMRSERGEVRHLFWYLGQHRALLGHQQCAATRGLSTRGQCRGLFCEGAGVNFSLMNLLFGRKWFSWPRIACLLITILLLWFIFRRIDLGALGAALKH